jgi:hypothetical protein
MFRWLLPYPKHLRQRRQFIREALADYPVYEPPHRQGPNFLPRLPHQSEDEYQIVIHQFLDRGRENLSHLLAHRDARMTALSALLAKFGVKMGFDDAGLAAVSAWCPGHVGLLIAGARNRKVRQVFFQALQPWTDHRRGHNVIFDLGIFLGECLIARNPSLHWNYQPGCSDDGVSNHSGYDIDGFKRTRDKLDPMGFIYGRCEDDEARLRTGNTAFPDSPDLLAGKVRDYSTR